MKVSNLAHAGGDNKLNNFLIIYSVQYLFHANFVVYKLH